MTCKNNKIQGMYIKTKDTSKYNRCTYSNIP